MKKLLWKSMKAGMKSAHGDIKWEIGKTFKTRGVELCERGFHASERIIDAMQYVGMEVLARVEVSGKSDIQKDKQAWSQMKVIKAYHWKKEDSVALSIFAAELVIKNFEKEYPKDRRPRKAIEAAKKWLKNPTEKNRSAAWSAAESAARSAAESAAWSAQSAAAWSAWSAAWSATRSAAWSATRSAAESAARSAAWSAAWSAQSAARHEKVLDKIEEWILKRVGILEEIK